MSDLLEQASLTEAEIGGACPDHLPITEQGLDVGAMARVVADAATAKALWAVVDWLRENCIDAETGERYGTVGFLGLELRGLLLQAGIERPKVEVMG